MNGKRVQIFLTEEAWAALERTTGEANEGFTLGTVSLSDTASEMLVNSKVDIKSLQLKHTNVPKILRKAAKDGMELSSVIKLLQDLKTGTEGKRAAKTASMRESAAND